MDRRSFVASVALAPLAWGNDLAPAPVRRLPDDVVFIGAGFDGVAVVRMLPHLGVRSVHGSIMCGDRDADLWDTVVGPNGPAAATRFASETLAGFRAIPATTVIAIALADQIGSRLIGPLLQQFAPVSSVHVVALLPRIPPGKPWTTRAERGLQTICGQAAGYSVFDEDALMRDGPSPQPGEWYDLLHYRLAGAAARAIADPGRRIANCSLPGEDFGWPGRREDIVVTLPPGLSGDGPTQLVFPGLFLRAQCGYLANVEGLTGSHAKAPSLAEARDNLAEAIVFALGAFRKHYDLSPQEAARNLRTLGHAVPFGASHLIV